jgi:hypothetical protein
MPAHDQRCPPLRANRRAASAAPTGSAGDVTHFGDVADYSLTWLPAPFLSQDVARTALDRLTRPEVPAAPGQPQGCQRGADRIGRRSIEPDHQITTAVETCSGQPVTLVMGQRAAR